MIKPNELRIGNYVKHIDKIIRIESLHPKDDDVNDEIPFHCIFGISLTEELLFEFGFLNFGYRYSKPELKLDIIKGDGYYLSNVSKEIEYVHQLQNLYFALTNKELEINI